MADNHRDDRDDDGIQVGPTGWAMPEQDRDTLFQDRDRDAFLLNIRAAAMHGAGAYVQALGGKRSDGQVMSPFNLCEVASIIEVYMIGGWPTVVQQYGSGTRAPEVLAES